MYLYNEYITYNNFLFFVWGFSCFLLKVSKLKNDQNIVQ